MPKLLLTVDLTPGPAETWPWDDDAAYFIFSTEPFRVGTLDPFTDTIEWQVSPVDPN